MKENLQLAEAYFKDLRDIHQTGGGVKEESYYGIMAMSSHRYLGRCHNVVLLR